MTFRPQEVRRFQEHFAQWKSHIKAARGCQHLELLHDVNDPRIFFTYSHWEHPSHLEEYRDSELFAAVWPQVKAWFEEPAEAWTLDREHALQ